MNKYEKLLDQSARENLDVLDYKFESNRIAGLYCNGTIALSKSLRTSAEKNSVLAEELGHYHTTVGDIIDLSVSSNQKQEFHARLWGYNETIGLMGLIMAYKNGCCNRYEVAEYLEVTESFLVEALDVYKIKYGLFAQLDNYIIYFDPLGILEINL